MGVNLEKPSNKVIFNPEHLVGCLIASRYLVRRVIARGGMGVVFEAEQLPLGRTVALKILLPLPGNSEAGNFEKRFMLEAASLARLSHPSCVTLHDYGETPEGTCYLVMEYVEGRTLSELLHETGPLPFTRASHLMMQVCRALAHAHRHGVIHRDLKPSNLLVQKPDDGDEQVKVVDFGLVKLARDDPGLTRSGTIMGSPHCMSPEQILGEEIDERTDIYAIGVLLYRCLVGEFPFTGLNSAATMIAQVQQPVPSLKERCPDPALPAGVDAIVRRCLEKSPSKRYSRMQDLLVELETLDHRGPPEVTMPIRPKPATSAPGARLLARARWAFLAGGAALVLGIVLWAFLRPPSIPVFEPSLTEPLPAPEPVEQLVELRSTPPGAQVEIDGFPAGRTPLRWSVQAQSPEHQFKIRFSADGYQDLLVERFLNQGQLVEVRLDVLPVATGPLPTPEPGVQKTERRVPRETNSTKPDNDKSDPPAAETAPEGYKRSPYE